MRVAFYKDGYAFSRLAALLTNDLPLDEAAEIFAKMGINTVYEARLTKYGIVLRVDHAFYEVLVISPDADDPWTYLVW